MASKPLRRLIVFHRHGQRAPAKDLSKDSPFVGDLGERDLWLPLMFPRNRFNCVDGYGVDSSVSYEQLQTLFPVVYYGKNGCEGQSVRTQSDRESFPFGCLTQLGAERMLSVGRSLRRNISTESEAEACQVEVWSTNYLRTQNSVQMLLSGLLGIAASVLPLPVRVWSSSTLCPMSFYDGNPLAKQLVQKVQRSDQFQDLEAGATDTKAILAELFPSLLIDAPSSGFDWPNAFDYFLCRKAHGLELAQEAAEVEQNVLKHYIDRYSLYFRDVFHTAHFCLPLLNAIVIQLSGAREQEQTAPMITNTRSKADPYFNLLLFGSAPSFTNSPRTSNINSCHSINIDYQSTLPGTKYWPTYGDLISMEALFSPRPSTEIMSTDRSQDSQIAFRYNNEVLPIDLHFFLLAVEDQVLRNSYIKGFIRGPLIENIARVHIQLMEKVSMADASTRAGQVSFEILQDLQSILHLICKIDVLEYNE